MRGDSVYKGRNKFRGRIRPSIRHFIILMFIMPLFQQSGFCQDESKYIETSTFFSVSNVGGTEIQALINEKIVYLSVAEVFDFLKIKNNRSPSLDSVSGFFIDPQAVFLIDRIRNRIEYNGKTHNLDPEGLIRTDKNLFLRIDYFGQIFGLECKYNLRSLSVALHAQVELPSIREMRQEQVRNGIKQNKAELKTDTTIGRLFPFFSLGMADWLLISTQQNHGPSDLRLNVSLGAILLGGETNVNLNYGSNAVFTGKQQFYQWRYVDNDFSILRQITVGRLSTQSTASVYSPAVGIQLTNTPTTYRRTFGTYTISDNTDPGWIVELYINNVLVDYVKADASGFFSFEVPIVYGNTEVKLRYYGPWGEEHTRNHSVNIPYNFLPSNEIEYNIGGGIFEDAHTNPFFHGTLKYGLNSHISIGGAFEYLTLDTTKVMVSSLNFSARLGTDMLISGEYSHHVQWKGIMNYSFAPDAHIELYYTRYDRNQHVVNTNNLEERKVVLSLPIRTLFISTLTRFTLNQIVLPMARYLNPTCNFCQKI